MSPPAKKPAKRGPGGLPKNAFRAGERFEDSLKAGPYQRLTRPQAYALADEYRAAAKRNAAAAVELGGQHGHALRRLARHFAQRAVSLGVQAGGLA